jgi:hypothetical protein
MYRSGLVPPRMASLGLIGGPVTVVGAIFVLFGAWEQTSSIQGILTLGEIAWEASLGIYLIVKASGHRRSSTTLASPEEAGLPAPCGCAVDVPTAAVLPGTNTSSGRHATPGEDVAAPLMSGRLHRPGPHACSGRRPSTRVARCLRPQRPDGASVRATA